MEVDELLAQGYEFNVTEIIDNTYDGNLLKKYYKVFSGDLDKITNATDSLLEKPNVKNLNSRALRYFLHTQSLLIDEIKSPFSGDVPSLEELNFDFQYYEDQEIVALQKLNYLALMEFWKDYI